MQPLWRYPAALNAVIVFVSGVAYSPKASSSLRRKASALLAHKQKLKEPAWDYGDLGGSDWSNVGYARCAMQDQSPVDLHKMSGAANANNSKLFYRYRPYTRAIPLFNDGRLVAWTVQEWRSEEVGHIAVGTEYPHDLTEYYSLFQVVVHTPSEHTFRNPHDPNSTGVRVPLELQLYHRKMSLDGGVPVEAVEGEAVVAIGFEESTETNSLLSALGSHGAPTETGEEVLGNNDGKGIDFASLFKMDPEDGAGSGESVAFAEYEGSMTTPPCSTGIKWFVRPDALPASHKVLETFRAAADAVAGARDAGAGNARALQDPGSRVAIWLDTTDATSLRTPNEVHDAMATNTDPKSHDGSTGDGDTEKAEPLPAEPVAPEGTEEPVTEDGGPVQTSTEKVVDGPMACQVSFHPSDVGAILCCWSAVSIETAPDIIIERNGAYVNANAEFKNVEKDLADAENNKNEQCQAYEDAKKEAETGGVGPEATAANQKASTYATGCEEAKKMVSDLSNEKESWSARIQGVRGEIEAALKKAREELKTSKGGFACTQESVEIMTAKAAETDPTQATVDRLHAFPRHLAPGNPKLIAGGDSGLVELQLPKRQRLELK